MTNNSNTIDLSVLVIALKVLAQELEEQREQLQKESLAQ